MIELFSYEAEEAVLGYLFNPFEQDEHKFQILQVLTSEHFQSEKHRDIFDFVKEYNILDKIVLWDKIRPVKKDSLDWLDMERLDIVVTKQEVESYIEILIDKHQKRKVYELGKQVQEAILRGTDQYTVALTAQTILTSMGNKSKLETNQELLEKVLAEKAGDVILSGYEHIDKFIGGYARGMIVTIAGDRGHLKTTLALDKSFRIAETNPNIKVAIFSKEMLATDLMKKQISRICNIPTSKIFGQDYDREFVRQKMMEVEPWKNNRIRIINPNSFSGVADIARIQMTHRFDVWFLDFIQMLE